MPSAVYHLLSAVCRVYHLLSVVCYLPSTVYRPSSAICRLSCVSSTVCCVSRLSSATCCLPSVVCHLPSTVCRVPSAACYRCLSSVVCCLLPARCRRGLVSCLLFTVYCLLSTPLPVPPAAPLFLRTASHTTTPPHAAFYPAKKPTRSWQVGFFRLMHGRLYFVLSGSLGVFDDQRVGRIRNQRHAQRLGLSVGCKQVQDPTAL